MSKTALLAATAFLLAVVVVLLVLRQPTPPAGPPVTQAVSRPPASMSAPSPPSTAPAGITPDPGDALLAKDSTDPTIEGFVSSFRSSSEESCRNSTAATLKTQGNADVAARISAVCGCASDRAVATLSVGDVRTAMLSAFAADRSANPAFQKLKASYLEAAKMCLTEAIAR